MSTSLYWSRLPEEPKEKSIGGLKYILAHHVFENDGSCSDSTVVGKELIPFLEGVVAGADDKDVRKQAAELIQAIKDYVNVKLILHS